MVRQDRVRVTLIALNMFSKGPQPRHDKDPISLNHYTDNTQQTSDFSDETEWRTTSRHGEHGSSCVQLLEVGNTVANRLGKEATSNNETNNSSAGQLIIHRVVDPSPSCSVSFLPALQASVVLVQITTSFPIFPPKRSQIILPRDPRCGFPCLWRFEFPLSQSYF